MCSMVLRLYGILKKCAPLSEHFLYCGARLPSHKYYSCKVNNIWDCTWYTVEYMFLFIRSGILVMIVAFIVGGVIVGVDFLRERFFTINRVETTWQTYTSQAFGFSINVPSDWTIVEFPNDEIAPRVNMYQARQKQALSFIKDGIEYVSPITHHSLVPNVSIFPHGVPTEGLLGTPVESDVSFSEETRAAHDFALKNGSHFATFAAFTAVRENWNEAGFIWSRAGVSFARSLCFRGDLKVRESRCDPLAGDTVVYHGRLKTNEREVQKTILSSFRFVK